MIFAAHVYDPEADEGRKRPSHFSKRDIRLFTITGVIAIIVLAPVYIRLKQSRDSSLCLQNLVAIASAVDLYASDNNDRLPPLVVTDEGGTLPKVSADGHVFSWVSLLSRYMVGRASFVCPSATDEENVRNENADYGPGKPKVILSSYGMYGALSAYPRDSIPSLSTQVVICDSSNDGANGTFDPLPFKDATGKVLPDGFVVGLDNSNFLGDQSTARTYAASKFPTRLSFPDSATSGFSQNTITRHPTGIHFLMADSHVKSFPAGAVRVQHIGKQIAGFWNVPQ